MTREGDHLLEKTTDATKSNKNKSDRQKNPRQKKLQHHHMEKPKQTEENTAGQSALELGFQL